MQAPMWFLEALARQAEVVRVEVHGAQLAARLWGPSDGPGLVLIHGGGAHAGWWDHVAPHLSDVHRVMAVDLSGHGDSDRRDRYDFEEWAVELLAVVDKCLPAGPVTLCGHSIGSFVALRAADRDPARIADVIVVDPPVEPLTSEQLEQRRRLRGGRPVLYPTREEAVAKWRPLPVQDVLPYVRDHIAEQSVAPVDGGWTWKFDPANFDRPEPTSGVWEGVRQPVSIVWAEQGMATRAAVDVMAREIHGPTNVVAMAGAGHHVMLDQPLALVAAVRDLLGLGSARVGGPTGSR